MKDDDKGQKAFEKFWAENRMDDMLPPPPVAFAAVLVRAAIKFAILGAVAAAIYGIFFV